jgi:hypothetical protein
MPKQATDEQVKDLVRKIDFRATVFERLRVLGYSKEDAIEIVIELRKAMEKIDDANA